MPSKVSQIPLEIAEGIKVHTFKDTLGHTLVIREPVWGDYELMNEQADEKQWTNQAKLREMALHLAVSFNGEEGVTLANLMSLDRYCAKEVTELMLNFQMDVAPDVGNRAQELIAKYLPDERSIVSELSAVQKAKTGRGFGTSNGA